MSIEKNTESYKEFNTATILELKVKFKKGEISKQEYLKALEYLKKIKKEL